MTTTALQDIGAFLEHLRQEQYAVATQRVRGSFLTEYLEHALTTEGTAPDLASAELMELTRAHAWLADAKAGRTRRRNTLRGPHAPSADASHRVRIITYNVFAQFVGTPWRLEVPPNPSGEYLDPDEAQRVLRTLAVQRPTGANAAMSIRTAALAALVAATGRPVSELAALDVADVQLDHRPPRILLDSGPLPLDRDTVRTVRRWLRQRAGITSELQGTDPGYLWVPTRNGGRRLDHRVPFRARRAAVRTLHDAHRRLVLELLGTPMRPGTLRHHAPTAAERTAAQLRC
ncbi:tyrosine-type recombinase/integrase [Streptomyces sp. DH12]|uniref:tyrosine-type recombinase/integrase n=1 Tax=Streptomyces sp. DH12 TaxID=2857010 RepID=UPI001E563837|nr:tyrosine-type recombinase/integrase [Streptomyces sp. DH12]